MSRRPVEIPCICTTTWWSAIIPERHLNNGQPSLHAALIASAAPKMGEHAVHVGAGVGYYTAILHRLVGRSGRVTAIEFDTGLAARLAANFAGVRNINVVRGDGSRVAFDSADIIYVNAGATKPAEAWLDRLTEAGRLILPMTAGEFPAVMYSRVRYFASSAAATIFSPGVFPQWRSFHVRGCATQNPKPRSPPPSRKAGHKR